MTAPVAPTAHTPLPPAPDLDDPVGFDTTAEAFADALDGFGDEMDAAGADAYANAQSAYESAGAAATSAGAAGTSAANAHTSETNAAASAASALNAPGTSATSTASRSLATGSTTFPLVQTGKLFSIGQTVVITRTSDPTKRMVGPITAFASDVLTVDVQLLSSTGGPYTDWTIALSAPPLSSIASQAEAEAGTANDKEMTPLRSAQAIVALARIAPDVIVQEQQASGTRQAQYSGGLHDRILNTLVRNANSLASLSSNRVTLPAGSYYARARAVCVGYSSLGSTIPVRAYLYNATDAAILAEGEGDALPTNDQRTVQVSGFFTLAASKAISAAVYSGNTYGNTAGTGGAVGDGNPEVYLTLEIWKVGQ